MQPCGGVVYIVVRLCAENGPKTRLFFVGLTEASKQTSVMVRVAERMLFRRPKRQPGLHPSTGLCV